MSSLWAKWLMSRTGANCLISATETPLLHCWVSVAVGRPAWCGRSRRISRGCGPRAHVDQGWCWIHHAHQSVRQLGIPKACSKSQLWTRYQSAGARRADGSVTVLAHEKNQELLYQSSGQDGGISRHTVPPRTTIKDNNKFKHTTDTQN